MKKLSSFILRISIAAALLVFLLLKTDLRSLGALLRQADPVFMSGALALFVLLNVIVGSRWAVLLGGIGLKVPFGRVQASYFASLFFNLVFPSTVGGDAVRTIDVARYAGHHSSAILATVILDRITGFFGLFTVLVFSLFFGFGMFREPSILVATFLLLALVVFFCALMFSRGFFAILIKLVPFQRVKEYLRKMQDVTRGYASRKRYLAAAWSLSVVTHVGLALVFYLAALAFGIRTSPIYFLIFVPMVTAFASLPVSIGGLGLRDSACVFVFGKVGLTSAQALALSFTNFAFMLAVGLLGGMCYVVALHRGRV